MEGNKLKSENSDDEFKIEEKNKTKEENNLGGEYNEFEVE